MAPLKIKGQDFVDPSGRVVPLRGVNLGGWLVEEIWMTPVVREAPQGEGFSEVKDHTSLWNTVEKRLGHDAMIRVRTAWRDKWIQASDFKRIHDLGMNHVRLPFLASLLDEPGGMNWLKKAVGWAKQNGLYVVLDMHGTPGGQSGEHHTGEEGRNRLWFDVENITKTEEAWQKLAKEFRGEPTVAVYDLMNEPTGVPNPAMLALVYNRLIQAVRKVDPDKPVLIDDAYRGFETTPHANVAGWTQVAYSLHRYLFDAKSAEEHTERLKKDLPRIKELQGYRDAPVYIGEFNLEPHGNPQVLREYVQGLDGAGFSWALWTYKTVSPNGPMGQWGIFSNPGPKPALNPFKDSEAELIAKLDQVKTENLKMAPGLTDVFRK
ncbi:MAG: hypothetical protein BGO01_10375 [Armatimonadetes bacterium 55-13]|nr:cellulase family glycosylhydrolase [Armatimonadota bacterium]OJU62803.1 MAG: hypothetical protein BGO01_10375 [Armatimonadetes bacterium 55-13]